MMQVETIDIPVGGELFCEEWALHPSGFYLRTGRVIRQKNLAVQAGRELLRDMLLDKSTAGDELSHFALGTNSLQPQFSDTSLPGEVFRDAFTQTVTTPAAPASIVYKYFLASTSANGNTLREAGLFNAASGGTLFARVVLSEEIVKTSARAYTFSWNINITAG